MNIASETSLFEIGGTWGDSIQWSGTEQFAQKQDLFHCHGHKAVHPKVGDRLKAEFKRSWILFEFVEVNGCSDPQDMFFAKVRLLKQTMK